LITEKTNTLEIHLKETYGNLLIKSTFKDIDVYLDGYFIGKLGSGVFSDITVGEHVITLEGNDYRWEGSASIIANKSLTLAVEPKAYSVFRYNIQDGATAVLLNTLWSIDTHSGNGEINLWAGDYTIKVFGDNLEVQDFSISINRADKYNFAPRLELNREFIYSGLLEELNLYTELNNKESIVTTNNIHNLQMFKMIFKIPDSSLMSC
jgi:hypothetical protein